MAITGLPTLPNSAEDFLIFRKNKPIWVHIFGSLPDSGNFLSIKLYVICDIKNLADLVKRIFLIARCFCWQLCDCDDSSNETENLFLRNRVAPLRMHFKGTKWSPKDMWDLPCLLHLFFWFHVSNYRNFWNNERWKSCIKSFSIMKLFHLQKPLSKWR